MIDYFDCHPLDGYRRLTFMMLDEEVVALSPSTTYRVLSKAGRLDRWNGKPSKKGTGFVQPVRAHQHWHTDISYLNLGGTFYYLCSFLDGASRAVVHWEIRESMTEADVECILERAKELLRRSRRDSRACSSFRSRSDQLWGLASHEVQRRNVAYRAVQPNPVVICDESFHQSASLFEARGVGRTQGIRFYRFVPTFDLSVRLRVVRRRPHVRHP